MQTTLQLPRESFVDRPVALQAVHVPEATGSNAHPEMGLAPLRSSNVTRMTVRFIKDFERIREKSLRQRLNDVIFSAHAFVLGARPDLVKGY